MKTLTATGITKQLTRLKDSLSHATYLLGGQQRQVDIFKTDINQDVIKIFVYLDDTVSGTVSNISLIDKDGDVVALAAREFVKPESKGLYSVFAYKFVEVEVS
ncbi:MAG: hypothetical protein HPY50_03505 [Firmicutes bacterium]|nr:hypothetical protein [Bacillota bacterium]